MAKKIILANDYYIDAAAVKYNGNDIGNLLDSKLPLSGGIMTGNINLNGSNLKGADDEFHELQLGTTGKNYWSFVEYGGDYRFYKKQGTDTLLGRITDNGWEGNVNGATPITSTNIGSQSVSYANNAGWAQPIFNNNTLYSVGDDVKIGDQNIEGTLVVQGVNGDGAIQLRKANGSVLGNVIHSGNIGSQSVNYAAYSGNANNDGNGNNIVNTYQTKSGAITTNNIGSQSVSYATNAGKDRVGVDLCANLKAIDISLGDVQLTKDQVNPVGFVKPSEAKTLVGAIIKRVWPVSTWASAMVTLVSFDNNGAVNLITAYTQKYNIVITLLYLDV